MAVPKKVLKRQTLRNIEYYGLQEIFDELYQKSLENRKFRDLMEIDFDGRKYQTRLSKHEKE